MVFIVDTALNCSLNSGYTSCIVASCLAEKQWEVVWTHLPADCDPRLFQDRQAACRRREFSGWDPTADRLRIRNFFPDIFFSAPSTHRSICEILRVPARFSKTTSMFSSCPFVRTVTDTFAHRNFLSRERKFPRTKVQYSSVLAY